MRTIICFLVAVTALSAPGPPLDAAQFYKDKPHTEWTPKEALKVLNDSPWGETYTVSNLSQMTWDPGRRSTDGAGGTSNREIYTHFRIRWLSAKPVRQALARVVDWSAIPKAQHAAAQTRMEEFVNQSFLEHIVISVDVESNHLDIANQVRTLLKSRVTSDLINNTYLRTSRDRRVWLQEYRPPVDDGLGAKFIFLRQVDGAPFLTPDDKEVRFVTELSDRYKLDVRFKVSRMMYQGQLEY